MHGNLLRVAPALMVLLVAGVAGANSPGLAELSTGAAREQSRFGARMVAETGVGSGTFISHEFSDDPYVYSALTLTPLYRLDRLPLQPNFMVSQRLQYEFTEPNNRAGRRFHWGDTSLALTTNNLYVHEPTGIRLGATVGTTIPVSLNSIATHRITASSASARAMWMGGGFTLMGSIGATKYFHAHRNEIREGEVKFSDGTQAVHCRSDEEVCMGGRYAMNWSTMAGMMVSYRIMPELSVTLDMAWMGGWRRDAPVDEFTSPNARDGNRTSDMTRALLNFSYVLTEKLYLSMGAANMQPLLTSDQKSWRNPLYDGHPRNNFTTFYLDAVYSI